MLATGIEEGRPRKRHTTERLYSGISHLPGVPRDLFTYPATRRSQCLGDFMYTEGYVALLKPFSDNTSLPSRSLLLYDLAHADAPLLPFIFCIMHVCSHGHPVHVIRKQTLYIVFPIGLRPDVSVGVLQ